MDKIPKTFDQLKTHIHNAMLLQEVIPAVGLRAWAVYSIIALYADYTTGISYPTYITIKALTGIGDNRTVKSCVKKLEEAGLLKTYLRKARNTEGAEYGRIRTFYYLKYPAIYQFEVGELLHHKLE